MFQKRIILVFFIILFLIGGAFPAFAAKDYNIKNDTESFLFINGTTGNIGIATTVPVGKLEVRGGEAASSRIVNINGTFEDLAGTRTGLYVDVTADQVGTGGSFGSWSETRTTANAGTYTNVISGSFAESLHSGNATVDHLVGAMTLANQYGSGPVINAYGIYPQVWKGAGTITNAYGLYYQGVPSVNGDTGSGAGTVTNQYGIAINKLTMGTSRNIGLFLDDGTAGAAATGDFGIYQEFADANYFAGNIGIGTSTVPAQLTMYSAGDDLIDSRTNIDETGATAIESRYYVGTATGNRVTPSDINNFRFFSGAGGFQEAVSISINTPQTLMGNVIGTVDFKTQGSDGLLTPRMTINDQGALFPQNVGIGTIAPAASLQVGIDPAVPAGSLPAAAIKGNLVVDGRIYGDGGGLTGVAGTISGLTPGQVPVASSGNFLIDSNIYASGINIGIGSSSPQWSLDVRGVIRGDSYFKLSDYDDGADPDVDLINRDGNFVFWKGGVLVGSGYANGTLGTLPDGTFIVRNNVGIGTTEPVARLHIGDVSLPNAMSITGSDAYIEGNLEVDGRIYGDGGGLSSVPGTISGLTATRVPVASSSTTLVDSVISAVGNNVGIGTVAPRTALDTFRGTLSGSANDYTKGQFTMAGGGIVTWAGPGGKLKWTNRFYLFPVSQTTSSSGYLEFYQPTSDIPAGQVYTGVARTADADGVVLNGWEALYAVHTPGSSAGAITYHIVRYTVNFDAPSNWVLIAACDATYSTIKLGSGVFIAAGGTWSLNNVAYVYLQNATPGTQQIGHLNLSGSGLFAGNVGIGTTAPVAALHVGGAGAVPNAMPVAGGDDAYVAGNLEVDGKIYGDGSALTGIIAANPTVDNVPKSNGTSLVDSAIYSVGGNVGIGVTSPQQKLEVDGKIYASGNFRFIDGDQSIFVGSSTAFPGTQQATGLGYNALANDTGRYASAVGAEAGLNNVGWYLSALGWRAGLGNTGDEVVGVGYLAAYNNQGATVLALGDMSAHSNTADLTLAVGYQTGWANSGEGLTALGHFAGSNNEGLYATYLGYAAGWNATGNYTLGVGYDALRSSTANNVVAIGYEAGENNATAGQFILKQNNVNTMPLIQGDFASGNVGIGTTVPLAKLQVGAGPAVPAGSLPAAVIKGNLVVDGKIYGDGSGLTGVGGAGLTGLTATHIPVASSGTTIVDSNIYYVGGNVGIGTANPGATLAIGVGNPTGNFTNWGLYVKDDASFDGAVNFSAPVYFNLADIQIHNYLYFSNETNDLKYASDLNTVFTKNDYRHSEFDHPSSTNPFIYVNSGTNPDVSNNQWGGLTHNTTNFVLSTGVNTGAGSAPTTIENAIVFSPRGTEAMRLTGLGNVGIGTTAPAGKMEVAGQYFSRRYPATTTINWANGNVQYLQLANGVNVITFTGAQSGGRYLLELKQPSSGAAGTVTWDANVQWPNAAAPTLTTTNSQTDITTFYYNGTNYAGAASLNYAL